MNREFLILVEFPHKWDNGYTLTFPTVEARKTYLEENLSGDNGKWGEENYRRIRLAEVTEVVN